MEDARQDFAPIDRAQAVIEFNLDGTIITANENFLAAMGYSARRDPGQASSRCSWRRTSATAPPTGILGQFLGRGEFQSAEYKRFGKGGKEVLDSRVLQSDPRRRRQAVQGGENSPPTSLTKN